MGKTPRPVHDRRGHAVHEPPPKKASVSRLPHGRIGRGPRLKRVNIRLAPGWHFSGPVPRASLPLPPIKLHCRTIDVARCYGHSDSLFGGSRWGEKVAQSGIISVRFEHPFTGVRGSNLDPGHSAFVVGDSPTELHGYRREALSQVAGSRLSIENCTVQSRLAIKNPTHFRNDPTACLLPETESGFPDRRIPPPAIKNNDPTGSQARRYW